MDSLYEKTLKSTTIYEGKIIDVFVEDVELPNGGKTAKREIVRHPGAVAVIAKTEENKYVFVRQFRKPLNRTIVEIPAGKIEADEPPIETAKRELHEETGYRCKQIRHVRSFYTSPGFADEIIHLFVATGLTAGEQQTEADEFLDVLELTLEEAEEKVENEEIFDAKTAYAVLYLRNERLAHE